MRPTMTRLVLALMLIVSATAGANEFDSGSDGSDGALVVMANETRVINLSEAVTAPWNTPSAIPGKGVYDAERWAVVFKYTTITIAEEATVTFANHPSGAPVVWLAQGDVVIEGVMELGGAAGFIDGASPFDYTEPGPGGFAGGGASVSGHPRSSGFGPGGGGPNGGQGAGSHSGTGTGPDPGHEYGSAAIVPFVGGSGGSGDRGNGLDAVGGAGGGAILIASSTSIMLTGTVSANGGRGVNNGGGGYGGSGGAIRMVSNAISGSGHLTAVGLSIGGAAGGAGRIRLEARNLDGFTGTTDPTYDHSGPAPVFLPDHPVLRAVAIDGESIPADPLAGVDTLDVCVEGGTVPLEIQAFNVPLSAQVRVYLRPAHGGAWFVDVPPENILGNDDFWVASVEVDLPDIQTEIQLKASWTP